MAILLCPRSVISTVFFSETLFDEIIRSWTNHISEMDSQHDPRNRSRVDHSCRTQLLYPSHALSRRFYYSWGWVVGCRGGFDSMYSTPTQPHPPVMLVHDQPTLLRGKKCTRCPFFYRRDLSKTEVNSYGENTAFSLYPRHKNTLSSSPTFPRLLKTITDFHKRYFKKSNALPEKYIKVLNRCLKNTLGKATLKDFFI